MEKGLTAQLMKSVTPIPRQCWLTSRMAAKSILISMGMIISQMRPATGRFTCASSIPPIAWNRPGQFFSRRGGLGQGLGLALGVKLAKPASTVVSLIGDGSFLYNPVLPFLGAARDYNLPTLTVIFDNRKYAAMEGMHRKMYPDGEAVTGNSFFGTHINAPDYVKVAESVGGYGERVDAPDALADALRRGLAAVAEGRPAIIDVLCAR